MKLLRSRKLLCHQNLLRDLHVSFRERLCMVVKHAIAFVMPWICALGSTKGFLIGILKGHRILILFDGYLIAELSAVSTIGTPGFYIYPHYHTFVFFALDQDQFE